jgi:D-amino-acid dehydrogenase
MPSSAIVIGAGITGVAAALCLARDGWAVTLVDRVAPGDPAQTSFGNAGLLARGSILPVQEPGLVWRAPRMLLDRDAPLFLRPSHLPRLLPWLLPFLANGARPRLDRIVPAIWALTRDTVEAHQALAAGTPAAALIETGPYAYLFPDRAAFAAEAEGYARKAAAGIAWRERPAAELDPALGPAYGFAAELPDHGWIADPGAYVAALADAAAAAGARILRAEVRDLRPTAAGVAVETDAGPLAADRAVLAAGVWSRALAARLGLRIPLETERGYHLTLRGPSRRPPFPMMLADRALVMTPMREGLRVAGLVEFGGTEAPPSKAPLALIRRAIRRAYPDLTWEAETAWMGHRPTTPDSLPALGPVPGAEAVICAFGGQHLGLTIGPRLGRLAADLAAGRRPNLDLAPYAPGRFA